jgi:peptidoglycan biosynthesis protein MviN/MurJ (putative lipid II flippase)
MRVIPSHCLQGFRLLIRVAPQRQQASADWGPEADANIVLDLVLVKLYGAVALGFGAALGTFINFLILFLFLRTELDLQIRAKGRFFWPVLCANTAIFFIALVAQDYWNIMEAAPSPLKWGYQARSGSSARRFTDWFMLSIRKLSRNKKKIKKYFPPSLLYY